MSAPSNYPDASSAAAGHAPTFLIVCLCAQWCGTCRDYRADFESLATEFAAHQFRWLDIEDEAELAGDLDIETFPTLLIAHASSREVLFAGSVLPRLADARRLIESLQNTLGSGQRAAPLQLPADQLRDFRALAARLPGPA